MNYVFIRVFCNFLYATYLRQLNYLMRVDYCWETDLVIAVPCLLSWQILLSWRHEPQHQLFLQYLKDNKKHKAIDIIRHFHQGTSLCGASISGSGA